MKIIEVIQIGLSFSGIFSAIMILIAILNNDEYERKVFGRAGGIVVILNILIAIAIKLFAKTSIMNTDFLNTEFFVLNLIMILSSVVILLKSRFNLIILIIYILFWAVLLILSNSLSITGICMSVIFGVFYYYVIPNQLKKERIEDEKITKDLEKRKNK